MTRRILINAAAVAALATPLVAGDQTVEKATRYRAPAAEVVEPVLLPAVVDDDVIEPSAQIDEPGAVIENESFTQIEELGGQCCWSWNQNADQIEELGPGMLNQADQVEDLGGKGRFYWNDSAEQVEELGPVAKKKPALKN